MKKIYNKADWNLTRGLIIHNEGNYNQDGERIGSGLYGDSGNPGADGLPRGGRLFHAQPLSGVTNPQDAEFYTIIMDGQQMVVREIVDENGFTNFWNNKNIPEICKANQSAMMGMLVFGTVMSGLFTAGLSLAAASKGIAGLLAETFNLDNGGGGGGGSGSGTGDPEDPGYVVRVFWKNIKQVPFAAQANGLVAIDGDLLVSSSRRLRSISSSAFSTNVETLSRVVTDTENAQVTFIDFDYQRFYGKRFIARETNAFAAYTPFGVGFGDAEGNAFNTPVLTPTSIRYGDWALSANGLVHKNAAGVYKKILWNDGAGYAQKNYHFYGVIDSSLQDATESGPTGDTLRDRMTAPNNTQTIDNVPPPEITAAPNQQTATPNAWNRTVTSVKNAGKWFDRKGVQLNEGVERGGTLLQRKLVQTAVQTGRSVRKVGKQLEGKALEKALANGAKTVGDKVRTFGRYFTRTVNSLTN